jgi:uncharacterized RDD family membrane protein YckC
MSGGNWYYLDGANERVGPVDESTLEGLISQGTLNEQSLVWREGMSDWAPYGAAVGESAVAAAANVEQVACEECGAVVAKDDAIRFRGRHVCAECKPVLMSRLSQGLGSNRQSLDYAGFWVRLMAKIVDSLLLFIVSLILGFLFASSSGGDVEAIASGALLVNVIIYGGVILYTWLFTWKLGGTPGKLALGLCVVTANGEPVGAGRALGRVFAEWLSGLILSIGYIIAAFDSQKRALHDHICGTRVVRR